MGSPTPTLGGFGKLRRTRDIFALVMTDPPQYAALRSFADSIHSGENFMFLESLSALEDLVSGRVGPSSSSPGATRALDRFVRAGGTSSPPVPSPLGPPSPSPSSPTETAEPTYMIEGEDLILYRKFYDSFVGEHAPCEINVPDSCLRGLAEVMAGIPGGRSSSRSSARQSDVSGSATPRSVPANMFDAVADEVMRMVYDDIFGKYVIRVNAGGPLGGGGGGGMRWCAGGVAGVQPNSYEARAASFDESSKWDTASVMSKARNFKNPAKKAMSWLNKVASKVRSQDGD
ncbi:hypothetical protein HK101_002941 [Irineochytrium annulatum]|nr:hypothetical protein HK101_002941 [Irineochytrium annulatum]